MKSVASGALETELRAMQVCDICRSRKKKCDKGLPICGYCSTRALVCHYTDPTTFSKPVQSNIPMDTAPTYPSPSPTSVPSVGTSDPQQLEKLCPSTSSFLLLVDSLTGSTGLVTVDDVLHYQVRQIIRTTGRYLDEITLRYFQGIHRWIPVISRRRFHDHLVDGRGLHTADFSILLLAMSLITYCPTNSSGKIPNQETLYLSTKMLFAQVQASVAVSTHLIQAGILLAIFEYASGRAGIAFVSVETCAAMTHALGSCKGYSSFQDHEVDLEATEEKNILWGIKICERLFSHEVDAPIQPLATVHPEVYEYLPFEVETLDGNDEAYIMPRLSGSVASLDSYEVGSFGRHAQVTYLTDKLRNASSILHEATRVTELSKVDDQLQEFLSRVMEQGCNYSWARYCGAISTSIRALFTLHQHTLNESDHVFCDRSSSATLDTLTKIVIDIAHSHEGSLTSLKIDSLPPSYTYIVRATLQHLTQSESLRDDPETWQRNYDALKKSQSCFNQRWGIFVQTL